MNLQLTFRTDICCTKKFTINGMPAGTWDFGCQDDHSPEEAEHGGCGNMQFTGAELSSTILVKYDLTKDEYLEIVKKLEDGLSFGKCELCV